MARTSAGIDWQASVLGATAVPSGQTGTLGVGYMAPANYIALSADTATPNSSDTTLPGELGPSSSPASTGLARKQATYAHTTGTNTYTLTTTFTSDTTVTVAKIGVFNASSAGVLFAETLLSSSISLHSGDTIQITETISL